MLEEITDPSFSGHETFPFRFGWLKKGVDAVCEDGSVFLAPDAMIRLGVGKNMVRSIRHWCHIAQLIAPSESGRGQFKVTTFGRTLFGEKGLDPFLEDAGTLWLMHWAIATNPRATTWYWMFNYLPSIEFNRATVVQNLSRICDSENWGPVSSETLERDVDCLVRTYAPASGAAANEDSFECPLTELGVLGEVGSRGARRAYRFVRGPKPSLPQWAFAYAVIDFWNSTLNGSVTCTLEQLAYSPRSPGRVFLLDEVSLSERLEDVEKWSGGALTYDDTAGLRQLYRKSDLLDGDLFLKTGSDC